MYGYRWPLHTHHFYPIQLLGLHLAIGLDCLDVLVALKCLDRVVIVLDTMIFVSHHPRIPYVHEVNLRKALDETVLVCDLAALVNGVLLGTINC
jgi:hypothetical protein